MTNSIHESYSMVNLTTLAPDIVAAILDEMLHEEVTLFDLAAGTLLLWEEQCRNFGRNNNRFRASRDS